VPASVVSVYANRAPSDAGRNFGAVTKGRGSHVRGGNVTRGESAGETVRVSVAELEFVRRLLFAAGNLAICVLESDAARVSDEVLEKARHLQALYGELAG
jgi:hypothetical protein